MPRTTTRPCDGIIDLVLVDRVVQSKDYAPLTELERAVAAARLHDEEGLSFNAIAKILRCNHSSLSSTAAPLVPAGALSVDHNY